MISLFWQKERIYALEELGLTPSTKVLLNQALVLSAQMEAQSRTETQIHVKEMRIEESYDRGVALRTRRRLENTLTVRRSS